MSGLSAQERWAWRLYALLAWTPLHKTRRRVLRRCERLGR